MSWVRLDDGYPSHPKMVRVGPLGLALQTAAICYCNEKLTDGFIPASIARRILDFDELVLGDGTPYRLVAASGQNTIPVDVGLVIEMLLAAGIWTIVEGGYEIHDYLEFQPRREDVLAIRKARSEAGRTAADVRWSNKTHGNRIGDRMADAMRSQCPNPKPKPKPKPKTEETTVPNGTSRASATPKARSTPSPEEIDSLKSRFDPEDIELLGELLGAIALSRRGGKMAATVQVRILQTLLTFPREPMLRGARTYLARACHTDGKNERYLYGIIRRLRDFPNGDRPRNGANGNGDRPSKRDMLREVKRLMDAEDDDGNP